MSESSACPVFLAGSCCQCQSLTLAFASQQCDMTEDLRTEALDIIVGGVEKYPDNMEAACKVIKESMDKKFGGPWHVRGCSLKITDVA